jgi:uncharacterized radical SAM superfamily Fe-S cluster-containing enzyme
LYDDYITTSNSKYLVRLIREFEKLKKYKSTEALYLGVARFVFRQELLELRKILVRVNQK